MRRIILATAAMLGHSRGWLNYLKSRRGHDGNDTGWNPECAQRKQPGFRTSHVACRRVWRCGPYGCGWRRVMLARCAVITAATATTAATVRYYGVLRLIAAGCW